VLLDIEAMVGVMTGVVMELMDCALPLLKGLLSASMVYDTSCCRSLSVQVF